MKFSKLILLALVVVLAACAKEDEPAKPKIVYKPLNKAEKQKVKNVMKSIGQVQALATDHVDMGGDEQNPGFAADVLMNLMSASRPPASKGQLKRVIDRSDCETKLPIDKNTGELKLGNGDQAIPAFSVTIEGDSCPVYISASVEGKQEGQGFVGTYTYKYVAHSDEFKQMSDVDRMDMKGTLKGVVQNSQNGQKMDMTVSLAGVGHSQKEGDFATEFSSTFDMDIKVPQGMMPTNNFGFEINGQGHNVYKLHMASTNALLEDVTTIKGIMNAKQEFFLNKKPISPEEYQEYMGDMWFPGMAEPQPDQGGDVAVKCMLDVYDARDLSYERLQEMILKGTPVNVRPLAFFNSCHGDQQFRPIHNEQVTVEFSSNPNGYWQTRVALSRSRQTQEFAVLPDEFTDVAGELGVYYTLRLTCDPEMSCQ